LPSTTSKRRDPSSSDQERAKAGKAVTVYTSKSEAASVQEIIRPEPLFSHLFGEDEGYLVTFTAEQARFTRPDARPNELAQIRQLSWLYPEQTEEAAHYLIEQAQLGRDCCFALHLLREAGNRRADNARPTVRALWLDEDAGAYPEEGPAPTAIIRSSGSRRHLYWQLSEAVSVEWAVEMNRRLAHWAGGDTSKVGCSSVLRAPGTGNFKRHPEVDLVAGEFTGFGPWEPDVLEQAIPLSKERDSSQGRPYTGPPVELEPYLEAVQVIAEVPDEQGQKFQIICPWVHEHSHGDRSGTRLGKRSSGALWFHCDHEHCAARGWREFKRAVGTVRTYTVNPNLKVKVIRRYGR
jgi:RepB DNA-primase from phage plasmid